MNANLIDRSMVTGPGRREVRLVGERPDGQARPSGRAFVRNRWTMIYPGVDVELVRRAEAEKTTLDLGRLALGEVVEAAAAGGPPVGASIYWNGPHADRGWLDPTSHVWALLDEFDPLLLPAGIGAEAEFGLRRAIETLGREPTHALVVGQGLLGHLGAQWLRGRGIEVTVVENSPKRLEFCKYLGLTRRLDTHNLKWLDRVDAWNPHSVDLLVDATGNPQVFGDLIERMHAGGVICRLGPWRPAEYPESLSRRAAERSIRVVGPWPAFGDLPDHQPLLESWIAMIQGGEIQTGRLITHRVAADEGPVALKRFAAGIRSWLGAVIDWSDNDC